MSDRFDSQEFHELMMDYRGSLLDPAGAYGRVLEFLRSTPKQGEALSQDELEDIYLEGWNACALKERCDPALGVKIILSAIAQASPSVEPAGWVRPSERMPNEGQFVFAAVHEWDQASAPLIVAHGQYKGGEWLACGEDQGTLYAPVFWMPAPPGIRLPAPPKDHP